MDTPSATSALLNVLWVVALLSRSVSSLPLLHAVSSSHTTHLQRVNGEGVPTRLGAIFHQSENSQFNHLYKFTSFGKSLFLNLTKNVDWMSGDILVEVVRGNGSSVLQAPGAESSCHFSGIVHGAREEEEGEAALGEVLPRSWAALSGCNEQLTGVIAVGSDYYFLEPGPSSVGEVKEWGSVHTISKTAQESPGQQPQHRCSAQSSRDGSGRSRKGEFLKRRRRQAMSREYFVEVALVTEPSMLRGTTYQDMENYLFAIMNIVCYLYRDASLGHRLQVALLRVVILDSNQTDILSGNTNDHPLIQFCDWMRDYDRSRGLKEDVAVLLTKQSMCDSTSDECNVLGMADIGSACVRGHSCNIVKDNGLSTAFSLAHELGHTLNMEHDGRPGRCRSEEKYIMASSFTESSNPHIWSACSSADLGKFLGTSQSNCLLNRPPASAQLFNASGTVSLPGFEYSETEQCQLKLGDNATSCSSAKDQCSKLWCRANKNSDCINFHSPPAPGTECRLPNGTGMGVCYKGDCVRYTDIATPVEGGWSQWSEWSNCSLPCGTGLQFRNRSCDSPVPQFGGHYCVGKRKEFQMCNKQMCAVNHTHRQQHCETHPPMPGDMKWTAVSLEHTLSLGLDVCKSHCFPGDSSTGIVYTSSLASLPDGTNCLVGQSRGVCLDGECVPIGCNGSLWTESSMDECGVWCGNGSSCLRVAGSFSDIESTESYHYYMALVIPTGSTHIHIMETTPSAANYIAVRGAKSDVFINGNFQVLYSGRTNFTLARTSWMYVREGSDGGETVRTDGPVMEDVLVYALASQMYPGIKYTFSLPKDKTDSLTTPVYFWKSSAWQACDAVCGSGHEVRTVTCLKLNPDGRGEEKAETEELCMTRKPAMQRECGREECVYSWVGSEWGPCNASCDEDGVRTRTVTCTKMSSDGHLVGPVAARHCSATPPRSSETCTGEPCLYEWEVGPWGSCNATCGQGWKERTATCVHIAEGERTEVETHFCTETTPTTKKRCESPAGSCTDYQWHTSEWNECKGECSGMGTQLRRVTCVQKNGTQVLPKFCSWKSSPTTQQSCTKTCPTTSPANLCTADIYSREYCYIVSYIKICHLLGQMCCKSCGLTS